MHTYALVLNSKSILGFGKISDFLLENTTIKSFKLLESLLQCVLFILNCCFVKNNFSIEKSFLKNG